MWVYAKSGDTSSEIWLEKIWTKPISIFPLIFFFQEKRVFLFLWLFFIWFNIQLRGFALIPFNKKKTFFSQFFLSFFFDFSIKKNFLYFLPSWKINWSLWKSFKTKQIWATLNPGKFSKSVSSSREITTSEREKRNCLEIIISSNFLQIIKKDFHWWKLKKKVWQINISRENSWNLKIRYL